jgi:hypothetical protein
MALAVMAVTAKNSRSISRGHLLHLNRFADAPRFIDGACLSTYEAFRRNGDFTRDDQRA